MPLRNFDLLWTDRRYRGQIEIELRHDAGWAVTMEFIADSTEQIYVLPGRNASSHSLREIDLQAVFVPPMTGIGTDEPVLQPPKIEQLLALGRPGEVLRNLLADANLDKAAWERLQATIDKLFGYRLLPPVATGAHILAECLTSNLLPTILMPTKHLGSKMLRKAGGNWVDGDRFFDRETEVEALSERIRDGAHTLLTAQRRMGKTSLVRETLRRLDEAGEITPLFVDLEDARDPQDAVAEIAAQTTTTQSLWRRIKRGFADSMQQVGDYVEEVGIGEVTAKLRGGIDPGTWKQKANAVFAALDEHDKPVALAIDELSILINRLLKGHDYLLTPERKQAADAFLSWLRRVAQEHRNIRLVVSGSISLAPILRQAGLSAHANVFSRFELDPWSEATASDCLAKLAAGYAIDIPADVRRAMCRMLRCCVPHHVQQFFDCVHEDLRRRRRHTATVEDVERVYYADMLGIRGQIDLEHYETRLRMVLGSRAYLTATELLTEAAVNGGVLTEQSIAQYDAYSRLLDDADRAAIEDVLRVLEHDGYLMNHHDGFRFELRLFEDWWRARYGRNFTPFADREPRTEP